jgi:thiol-disulfide isomerase/thioredoxin
MYTWLAYGLTALLMQQPNTEARIIEYLRDNLQPGERVVVSDLFNDVFTTPEERAALDRLYDTFFKVPIFLAQFQTSIGRIPSLAEISEQFRLTVPGAADVILRVMESDPRVPPFFERDSSTGEITSLDVTPILNHPQFGRAIERTIAGWEGATAPPFSVELFDGNAFTSDAVAGVPHMIYVWFTNCPPCVQTGPLLVELDDQFSDTDFEIVAANADRVLELPYDDQVRAEYVEKLGIQFTTAYLNNEMQNAYGGISVFPTMFFVDRNGTIVRHFVNFQEKEVLEEAIRATME